MKENKKLEQNKIDITEKNELTLETKLQSMNEEILKIQNSFSNLIAQDKELKKQIDLISGEKNDLLDNEIWVVTKIEEAKQETENLIYDKIKKLKYEKTIKKLNESLEIMTKNIQQVSYNNSRELESLEEDLILKIEDSKVIADSILEDKIFTITEETIKNLKKDINSLEKKVDKEISKLFKELKNAQEETFTKLEKSFSEKIKANTIENDDEIINVNKLEKNLRDKLENKQEEPIIDSKYVSTKDSIINSYSNIKHTNEIKDLLIENNKAILSQVSKYDRKISGILKELDNLQNNISQIQTATTKDLKELETKINNNILTSTEQIKQETNKSVEDLINRIEETKKISEKQQKVLKEIFDKKIKESEDKNKELINQKINELNIDKIKDNINKLEKLTEHKINEISKNLIGKIENSEIKNQQLIIKEIASLEIDKLKADLKQLESSASKKVEEIQSVLIAKIQEEKQENEKLVSRAIEELNIDEVKTSISKLEELSSEKIDELENILTTKIEEQKEKSEQAILKAIEELNIEETKNKIQKLEHETEEKAKELEDRLNTKIEDLNYFDTIKNIENTIVELKEKTLNLEYSTKAINKKTEELDSINQKKLDKVKKEQEKFIISTISELGFEEKVDAVKVAIDDVAKKVDDIETLSKNLQEENFAEMQDYIEKRILRMKFATTVTQITEEISKLKETLISLQNAQDDQNNLIGNIEHIIQEQLQEKESELMKNVETIMIRKLKEQETNYKKKLQLIMRENYQNTQNQINEITTQIDSIVEAKVKETIKEMAKKQKAKKMQQAESKKQEQELLLNSIPAKKSSTIKSKNKEIHSTIRNNVEMINTVNISKNSNKKPSLDDMVAKLSTTPNTSSRTKTQKSISTLKKAMKKSQILNQDNY